MARRSGSPWKPEPQRVDLRLGWHGGLCRHTFFALPAPFANQPYTFAQCLQQASAVDINYRAGDKAIFHGQHITRRHFIRLPDSPHW